MTADEALAVARADALRRTERTCAASRRRAWAVWIRLVTARKREEVWRG